MENDNGGGFLLTQGAANNCLVSTEAYDSWNEVGAPNDHGGNSDGYKLSYGAHDNYDDTRTNFALGGPWVTNSGGPALLAPTAAGEEQRILVRLGPGGTVSMRNARDSSVHVTVEVEGWFAVSLAEA